MRGFLPTKKIGITINAMRQYTRNFMENILYRRKVNHHTYFDPVENTNIPVICFTASSDIGHVQCADSVALDQPLYPRIVI